ncbi:MAG: hypothetical protein J6D02_03675 [Lachnospira sp.]|nr:hypothetical protein [Lachnospira sp.]
MEDYSQWVTDPAKGKLKYLRPLIVLVPTLIVCIFNISTGIPLNSAVWRLLITILLFFAVGTVAQNMMRKIIIQAELDAVERQKKAQKEKEEASLEGEESEEDLEEEAEQAEQE